jgi:uncharacterized repeat protein (TIGR01451 family)
MNATLPAAWSVAVEPGSRDLRLVSSVPEINAGAALPNLDDPFVTDGQPDMGAFEYGQPLPQYGPRALVPDLSSSTKQASRMTPKLGETLSYTIILRNMGAPLTDTVRLTDTVPGGLIYVTGSLTATLGAPDASGAPTLRWTGALDPTPVVTLTYRVTVTASSAQMISNTVTIDAGTAGTLGRSAVIVANRQAVYLPITLR